MDKFDDLDGLLNNDDENKEDQFTSFIKKVFQTISERDLDIVDAFGEPKSIEYFEEDGYYVQKKTWSLNGSEIVEVVRSNKPFDEIVELTLEERLKKAIEEEDYEEAVVVRELMKLKLDGE